MRVSAAGRSQLARRGSPCRNVLRCSSSCQAHKSDQAIIHRDLKSPNLLLAAAPPSPDAEDGGAAADAYVPLVKITDFGLSRDKGQTENAQTAMMTGCGSVLWMAPEILLGDRFNEKVDVYSFAMCLLEVASGQLPWAGTNHGTVPLKVTQKQRPAAQLQAAAADPAVALLVADCWQPDPRRRPGFGEITDRLEVVAAFGPARQWANKADGRAVTAQVVRWPASTAANSGVIALRTVGGNSIELALADCVDADVEFVEAASRRLPSSAAVGGGCGGAVSEAVSECASNVIAADNIRVSIIQEENELSEEDDEDEL